MEDAYKELSASQRLAQVQDYSHVLAILLDTLQEGDVVLLKASNGVQLHKVVADLLSASAQAMS
jgi:UDP-N-acetylmuramyl pentapeptide synthase